MKKVYLTIGTTCFLSVFLIVFVICPLFKGIVESSQDFLDQREKMALLKEKENSLSKSKRFFQDFYLELTELESFLFNPDIPIEFINFLENVSDSSQVSLEIGLMTKEGAGDLWPGLSFRVSTTGSFVNTLRFLDKLENSFYLIEVSNLNIRKLTDREIESGQGKFLPIDVVMSLSFLVYTR